MREEGIIIKIEDGFAVIKTIPSKECKCCSACASGRPREIRIKVDNADKYAAGDRIVVEVPSHSIIKLYMLLYGLPLLTFMAALTGVYYFSQNPVLSFFAAVASTLFTYVCVGRLLSRNQSFIPKICPLE